MDLVTNSLGSDLIPHTTLTTQSQQLESHDAHETSNTEIKRVDSDEEDKGLIREELLKGHKLSAEIDHDVGDADGDADDDEVEPIQTPVSNTISILLQDFLILRIENGRDYFLTITAQFSPTMEGN